MRFSLIIIIFILGILSGFLISNFLFSQQIQISGTVESVISPGTQGQISAFLLSASNTADIEMYEITKSSRMIEILETLHLKGVKVRVILEPTVEQNLEIYQILKTAGIETKWASGFKLTHSKIAIIDNSSILIGSINWSYAAMNLNREAALIVRDINITKPFLQTFESDWLNAKAS